MGADSLYILLPMPDGSVKMTKFVDGEPKTDSVYYVRARECQCWQAKRQCRHMIMFARHRELGGGRMSVDYDRDIYTPLGDEE